MSFGGNELWEYDPWAGYDPEWEQYEWPVNDAPLLLVPPDPFEDYEALPSFERMGRRR